MKKLVTLLLILMSTGFLLSQNRILVTPDNDAISLNEGENAVKKIQNILPDPLSIDALECNNKQRYGYPPIDFPLDIDFGAFHKDVVAMWFVAPATGYIDTLFWYGLDSRLYDSTIEIRIYKSNIGPNSGPGINYPSACSNWGYYPNIYDPDQGIAPNLYEATGAWISTVAPPYTSFPPLGFVMAGEPEFPINVVHRRGLNFYSFKDSYGWGSINVTRGDSFFVTMRVPGYLHVDDPRTSWAISNSFPTYRVWKFYEHATSTCGGTAVPGWKAREFGVYNWFFSMRATSNVSPMIENVSQLHHTLNTSTRVVTADILDCDYQTPGNAGVASAVIKWWLNGTAQSDVTMSHVGGTQYQGNIPDVPDGGIVEYIVRAVDTQGLPTESEATSYHVVKLENNWYTVDTGIISTAYNISTTGTLILPSQFFNPQKPTNPPADDGTAGPFDLGGPMNFNGDIVRYAWVGVNGAIALTASELDSQDVNADGNYSFGWDIPNGLHHDGRSDIVGRYGIPKNFVSPFWNDLVLNDGVTTFGKMRRQQGYNGDTCLFIVEWDSIGFYNNQTNQTGPDITTFRTIFNRCTGEIEFQYKSVGTHGLDSTALTGIEKDSSGIYSGDWLFVNKQVYPFETKPRNNWSIKFVHTEITEITVNQSILAGWSMLSVPVLAEDYSASILFPDARSNAFTYRSRYVPEDPVQRATGYWFKYDDAKEISFTGPTISEDSVEVARGWNMIGSISTPIHINSISSDPPSMTLSQFYRYNTSAGIYETSDSIKPGSAYWVRTSEGGKLYLTSSTALMGKATIRIVPESFQPPSPPGHEINESKLLPKEYALEQNHPNPFNPTTVIKYQLPADSRVRLKIYNTLGQEVATLADEIQDAGYKSVEWNAGKLPTGVYMYRLTAGSFADVKKLLLVK